MRIDTTPAPDVQAGQVGQAGQAGQGGRQPGRTALTPTTSSSPAPTTAPTTAPTPTPVSSAGDPVLAPGGLAALLSGLPPGLRDAALALLEYQMPVNSGNLEKLASFLQLPQALEPAGAALLVSAGTDMANADMALLSDIINGRYSVTGELSKLAGLYLDASAADGPAVVGELTAVRSIIEALAGFGAFGCHPAGTPGGLDNNTTLGPAGHGAIDFIRFIMRDAAANNAVSAAENGNQTFNEQDGAQGKTQDGLQGLSPDGAQGKALVGAREDVLDGAQDKVQVVAQDGAQDKVPVVVPDGAPDRLQVVAQDGAQDKVQVVAPDMAPDGLTGARDIFIEALLLASRGLSAALPEGRAEGLRARYASDLINLDRAFAEYFAAHGAGGAGEFIVSAYGAAQTLLKLYPSGLMNSVNAAGPDGERDSLSLIHNLILGNRRERPEDIFGVPGDSASKIKQTYEQLITQLSLLRASAKQPSPPNYSRDSILRQIDVLRDGLNLMDSLNSRHQYVQIPLYFYEKEADLELYVMKRGGKKKKISAEDATLYFAINTHNIGVVEALIHITKNKYISLDLRAGEERTLGRMRDGGSELRRALADKGYKLSRVTYRATVERLTPANAIKQANMLFPGGEGRIDCRI